MNLQKRLYTSAFVNSFGSWLTFLAVALLVKEKYGGQQVAWVFLVQTLPAIIFSRGLSNLIPEKYQEKVYYASQILLAANSFVLCFNQGLPVLYFHLVVGSFIKSVSNPLFNTLVGRWISNDKLKDVFTKIGSIQTSTLALAPIIGAWVKIVSSYELLFFLDAVSFVIAALVLNSVLLQTSGREKSESKILFKDFFSGIAAMPKDIPSNLKMSLILWFGFLVLGAFLNALEFPGFERLHMSEASIGYALAAWGVGSLIAFIKKNSLSTSSLCILFVVSLILFFAAPSPAIAVISFAAAGWASAHFSGALRADIQSAVPEGYNALPVWAFANQVTQLINLVAYASVGLLLARLGFTLFSALIVVIGLLIQIAISYPSVLAKKARS
jgi:hypothetical protein